METGKSRRSSILKPHKPRNPLSDLALIEPDDVDVPVATTRRSIASRRVSFASSNYVKEFATDLEKNTTIWDTTYEETVDKSDSTHSTEITQNPFETQSEKSSVPNKEPTKMPENLNQSHVCMPNEATGKIGSIKYGHRKASLNFNEQGGEDIESDSSLCGTDDFENRIIETRSIQPSNNIMNASVLSTTSQINKKIITQKFLQIGQLSSENAHINVKGIRDSSYLSQISSSNTGNISSANIFRQSKNLPFTEKEKRQTQSDPHIIIPVLSHRKLCQSIIKADDQYDTSKVKPPFKKEDNVLKKNKGLLIFSKSSTALKVNNVDNTESVEEDFTSNKSSCIMKSETVVSNSTMKLTQQLSEFPTNMCKNTACLDLSNMDYSPKLSAFNKSGRGLRNKTIVADENMDITQQLPIVYKNNYNAHVEGTDKIVFKGNVNKTVIADENMEITQEFPAVYKNICNINKDLIEKTTVKDNVNKTVVTDENMDIAQELPTVSKNTNYNVTGTNISEVFIKNKVNKTVVVDENMEFTQEFTQQFPTVHKNSIYRVNQNSMGEVLVKGKTNEVTDENMEFTQQLPAVYKSNNYKENAHVTYEVLVKDKINKTIVSDENMEFTQQLPVYKATNYNDQAHSIGGVLVKAKTNRTIITDDNMEFTQQLPAVYKSNNYKENAHVTNEVLVKDKINKTIVSDENMEFTQQLPVYIATNYNDQANSIGGVLVKAKTNRTIITDDNMEFTQQLLAKDKINKTVITDENMEFTQQLPAVYKLNYNVVNSVGEVLAKAKINKTVISDENMEFTQQLPAVYKSNYNVVNSVGEVLAKDKINKSVISDENMEFTQQLPAVCETNYNVVNSIGELLAKDKINKTVISDENMEFTQQLPDVYKSNNVNVKSTEEILVTDKLNKTIVTDEIMEFTQQLPIVYKDTNCTINANRLNEVLVDKSKRTNATDKSLEMKQQLPSLCKSNLNMSVDSIDEVFAEDKVHKTTVADENMEFTQQLPAVHNGSHHTNVNTINDVVVQDKNKTIVADENMKCNQQLPILYSTNYFASVNTNSEAFIKDKQSITIVEHGNTEFTQQLPTVYTNNEVLIEDKPNKTIALTEYIAFSKELPDICSGNYNANGNADDAHVSGKLSETVLPDDNTKFIQQLPPIYINNEVVEVKLDKTMIITENMEFSQELPVICGSDYNANGSTDEQVVGSDKLNKPALPDEKRELPPDYTDNEVIVEDKLNKTLTVDKNMGFSQQLPTVDNGIANANVNTDDATLVKDKINKSIAADENIDFNQQLPVVCSGANTNNEVDIQDKLNKTIAADESLGFIQLPAVINSNYNAIPNSNDKLLAKEKMNETADDDMEFSQQLPFVYSSNYSINPNMNNLVLVQDKLNKTVVADENVEFAQKLSAITSSNCNNESSKDDALVKDKLNKTIVTDENMEYSQQLLAVDNGNASANLKTNHVTFIKDKINKTVVADENVKYSQQLPAVDSGNANINVNTNEATFVKEKVNKTVVADENMEYSQQLSAVDNDNANAKVNTNHATFIKDKMNKTGVADENMEYSQQLPAVANINVNTNHATFIKEKVNKTVVADENTEYSQQLPAVDKGNANAIVITNHATFIKDKMNKTDVADENMEYSQQLPTVDNGNVNTNHATFIKDKMNKTVVADENMEHSQQLPSVYSGNCNANLYTNNEVLDKLNKSATAYANMEQRQELPAVCNSNYIASATTNDDVLIKNNLTSSIETNENIDTSQQFLTADRSNCNPINKTMMKEDIEINQHHSATNFPVLKVNSSVESLTKGAEDVNIEYINTSQTETSVSLTQQLYNRVIENDGITENDAVTVSSTTVSERNVECRRLSLEDENKVLQDLSSATENIVTYNHENGGNPNKLKDPTSDQSIFINRSLNISAGVKNEKQDSEFNKDGINITGSTPMDVDSIIMTDELPVVLKPNTEGLKNISTIVNSLFLSPLKCENDKGSFNSPAVGVTSMDNFMMTSPFQPYKNKIKNDTMSQNKEAQFLLQLEDDNEKSCLSSNNHEDLDGINQKLPLENSNVKTTDVSLVVGKNKCMNLSNDAFQQFHAGSDNLIKLCPNKNQNLDMFIDVEKCNALEFVGENVNNPETQIDLESGETKMVHKNLSLNKQNISCSGFKTPGSSFHTTFTPCSPGIDDTQHLINYSLTRKQPKSDFSKIIAGDLNPSFMNSKYMALSEFSSDAFPVSLETSRANQTHLEHMGLDKVKDWDIFPMAVASDHGNNVQFEDEEINKGEIPTLSESTEAVYGNQNNFKAVEIDKKSGLFSDSVETIDSKQTHHAQQMELGDVTNDDGHNKDKPPLLIGIGIEEINIKGKGRHLKRPSLENIENVVVCKKAMLDNVEVTVADIINLDENMEISTIQINRTANISQEDISLCDDISYVHDMHADEPLKMTFTHSIEASVSTNISTFEHSVESKKLQEQYTNRIRIKQKIEDFMEKMTISVAAITKNSIKLGELYDEESKEISRPFKVRKFIDLKSNSDSSAECSLVEAVSDNNIAEHRSPFHMDSDDGAMDIQQALTLKEKIEEKQKRCKRYWKALSVADDKCEFDTLFKTIRLVVLLHPESGIVKKTNIYCNILDESEPTALYVHNILKERLSQKAIKSAVGEQYDILTLLDYVYMNMQQIVELLNEFDGFAKRFNLKMDKDFRVTFKLVNLHLRSTWCISVDMSNMENITEDSVTAHAKIGSVNEREIKRFLTGCPRGTLFLRSFINNILGYIELLKKRKAMIKSKVVDII